MATSNDASPITRVSGYPKELFPGNEDPKFVCNFCSKVLRDPVQSFCGHRFCRGCIEGVVSSGEVRRCLMCEKDGEDGDYSLLKVDQMFPDNAVKREMASLPAVCPNEGCTWTGTFKQYEAKNHYDRCDYRQGVCPSCGQVFPLNQTTDHLEKKCPNRITTCKFCKTDVTISDYESHNKLCPKFPVKCEGCGKKKIPREQIQQHMEGECPNQKLQCPAGCGLVPRQEIQKHLSSNMAFHQHWMIDQLVACKTELSQLSSSVSPTVLSRHVSDTNDKIATLERKVSDLENGMTSQQQQQLVPREDNSDQYVALREKISSMEIKANAFEGIAGVIHRDVEKAITHLERQENKTRSMEELLESLDRKCRTLERTLALKDIALTELEFRLTSMENSSFDGTLIWKIPDFLQKQRDAVTGKSISIYSPAFFTCRRGYKMCARLYPNGDGMGKGSHLSVFFVVMRGNFDAILKWPFQQRVSFCLVNQKDGGDHVIDSFRPDPTSSSFQRPTTDMNIASGCPLFTRLETLKHPASGFVRDDTMFVKVSVNIKGLQEPMHNIPE